MGWEDNNYDWMDSESGGGYADTGEGMDFGPNQDTGINWNQNPTDNSWNDWADNQMSQPWQQETLPGYDAGGNFLNGAAAKNMTQAPQSPGSGIEGYLSKMFANPTMGAKLFGALFEGNQNKKRQSDLNSIANRQAFDPFGSQRPFYQQQLQNTVNDPYNQPMVKAQIDNVQRMQDIKDAAAGRRSNQLHSAPGVAAAQAEIAQKYMNSLQTPAGANLKPDSTALASLWSQASKSGIDGYTSPLLSVLGNGTRNTQNQDALAQLKEILGRA